MPSSGNVTVRGEYGSSSAPRSLFFADTFAIALSASLNVPSYASLGLDENHRRLLPRWKQVRGLRCLSGHDSGRAPTHEDLYRSTRELCESRLGESSIFRLLARHGHELFPDEAFADLYARTRRWSIAPGIVALLR
jgi:hypothetical protein